MNYYMSKFVDNLKDLMKEAELTHEQLSKQIGCGHGCVSQWLTGSYFPKIQNIIRLTDFFQCSADYLFGRVEFSDYKDLTVVSSFPERYSSLIKEKGKTLYKIAVEMEIKNAYIYRWAKSDNAPNASGLILLADYFNCTIDYLIGRKY